MSDAAILTGVLVAFAALVTAHVAIGWGLVTRAPRWHAAVALLVPPAAPWLAWRCGLRVRAVVWSTAVAAYVALRIAAG